MRTNGRFAKPYCQCWNRHAPLSWTQIESRCSCGEESDAQEWNWEQPVSTGPGWVVVSENKKQVTFHPYYSSGTAAVRGDTALLHDHHYYWEIKMLTETYGTDIMIGLGTNKVNISDSQFQFISLLGQDKESYGLSYTGAVRHNSTVAKDSPGFCRGSIIGVRVDMWRGTLEFYINRQAQGISFYNLRRHQTLFPMLCSTAAQSSMRLIYAASWRASLLVDAAKILSASLNKQNRLKIPPGLWYKLKSQFWLTLPTDGDIVLESDDQKDNEDMEVDDLDPTGTSTSMIDIEIPDHCINGYYVDNVDPAYRIVLWH
ncbi:SPRY domain-containing SOCS box protein 3 isoform X2 [Hyposmocoma kahamanoa]|nr:SPRY domain-containing SOCS box protein 3 isoform X2 [Hyposmocoma kahamanoa]XP_026327831.1 SPRY domain-containing SOCS box protein 3 isoform X2 [Hyposmocoma kahamanoa]